MGWFRFKPGVWLLFAGLTALTQIGGVVYLAARWVSLAAAQRFRFGLISRPLTTGAGFCALYLITSIWLLPPVATALGRPPLPCSVTSVPTVAPLNRLTCLFNRHYARQPVHNLLAALSRRMNERYPGTTIAYLDANFALLNGFPMLPHLSHDDGLKVDLAFFYSDGQEGYQPRQAPSPIGYWAFERPRPGDPRPCANRNDLATLRWDMAFLEPYLAQKRLDEYRTGHMVRWLSENAAQRSVDKILLEPHLKVRFGLTDPTVRFQGCRAARHDDHVHVAMKPAAR